LECLATIVFLINEQKVLTQDEILKHFKQWSEDKVNRYSEDDIVNAIDKLYNHNISSKLIRINNFFLKHLLITGAFLIPIFEEVK
jgi:hypothetical protein